jgi:hypothetical protein
VKGGGRRVDARVRVLGRTPEWSDTYTVVRILWHN